MARTVDHLADSDSLLATGDPELTARFVNDVLPHLSQINDRARRLTCNGVDAEDLVQETMLRAYAGFNTFSEETNVLAWLFRVMTSTYINYLLRAHRRPSEYLADRIVDGHSPSRDRQSPDWPRSFDLVALDASPDIELADALMTLPVQCPLAVDDCDVAELRCRGSAESMARCEDAVIVRLQPGQGLSSSSLFLNEPELGHLRLFP